MVEDVETNTEAYVKAPSSLINELLGQNLVELSLTNLTLDSQEQSEFKRYTLIMQEEIKILGYLNPNKIQHLTLNHEY